MSQSLGRRRRGGALLAGAPSVQQTVTSTASPAARSVDRGPRVAAGLGLHLHPPLGNQAGKAHPAVLRARPSPPLGALHSCLPQELQVLPACPGGQQQAPLDQPQGCHSLPSQTGLARLCAPAGTAQQPCNLHKGVLLSLPLLGDNGPRRGSAPASPLPLRPHPPAPPTSSPCAMGPRRWF